MKVPDGADAEKQKLLQQQCEILQGFRLYMEDWNTTDDGAPDPYDPAHPTGGAKASLDAAADPAAKDAVRAAYSEWNCYRYMSGSYLLAKNIKAVNAFFLALGPSDGKIYTRPPARE